MATGVLALSTAQVAGIQTTQVSGFTAVNVSTASLTPADMAAISNSIVDDQTIVSRLLGPSSGVIQGAVIFTASATQGATTLTSFSLTSPATASISSLKAGMYLSGPGLAPGTRILSATGTTVTINNATVAATTTQTYVATGVQMNGYFDSGQLTIPGRGTLQVFPGDYVFVDLRGFPYLVPATSVGASGSGAPWIYT